VRERKPSIALVKEVLAGRVHSVARLITRAELGDAECRPALAAIHRHTGAAHIVGMTGVPGSGKSTLVRVLAALIRQSGRKVGIVAIDPSSPFSGGAILGDRVRMTELIGDPGVFIRSMATRGALGGLARAAFDAVDLLDAAGFDVILIETVGVGQDEVDVVQAAHTTVVVSPPGLGDDIQTLKAGILEIADIHVVSKCDRADANRTLSDLARMLTLGVGDDAAGSWAAPVLATSAESGQGIDALLGEIDRHRSMLGQTGELAQRCRRIAQMRTLKIAEEIMRAQFADLHDGTAAALVDRVTARDLDPHAAAHQLLATLTQAGGNHGP